MSQDIVLSKRTLAIMFTLKENWHKKEHDAKSLVIEALKDLYTPHLSLKDCIHHLLCVVSELRKDRRYCVGPAEESDYVKELLFSPLKYKLSVDNSDKIQYIDLYNEYMNTLTSLILLSNIGWCKQYQDYKKSNKV